MTQRFYWNNDSEESAKISLREEEAKANPKQSGGEIFASQKSAAPNNKNLTKGEGMLEYPHKYPLLLRRKIYPMKKANTQKRDKKAFALVLALALMGFMVLLTVSLATMVSMQMRLSRQNTNAFKARQAAKYSAYRAMAQIQSALGPDQRITANAAMLTSSTASAITSLDSDSTFDWWSSPMNIRRDEAEEVVGKVNKNRYWVGVWNTKRGYQPEKQTRDTSRGAYVEDVLDKAVIWLVSGNDIADEEKVLSGNTRGDIKFSPDTALTDENSVKLVSNNSYQNPDGTNDGSEDVSAPLVVLDEDGEDSQGIERNTGIQTRIAWWVSDEGQKASLNAIAPYAFKKEAETVKFRVQSLPFYSGVQGLTVGANGGKMYDLNLEEDGADDSGIMIARNASALDQLDAIHSQNVVGSSPSKYLFHAATCDTKGLLVNVRDGGLKKDLSLGLIQTNSLDDENARTTEKEISKIPEYFPRPYGVMGYFNKTTAYPIKFTKSDNEWRNRRRELKPELTDTKFIGDRDFAGHIFGPQMFTRDEQTANGSASKVFPQKSFGKQGAINDWNEIFCDSFLWKDPGGALWDQLRSYYNLRSPDSASASDISARVQTDDRFGAKPVVKRFQVHYVPALVDYGQQRYGLRLHIVPTLVLWNPYDTKIGEDTYYAIRVTGRDFKEHHNPIGSFRFAIGYQTGDYFQCIRDIYTEKMQLRPNNGNLNQSANDDFKRRFGFRAVKFGVWSTTEAPPMTASADSTWRQFDPLSGYAGNANNNSPYSFKMSSNSPFYSVGSSGGSNSNQRPWLPFGYGEAAKSFIPKQGYDDHGAFPAVAIGSFPDYTSFFPVPSAKLVELYPVDWRSIVNDDNMVPNVASIGNWQMAASDMNLNRRNLYNIGELERYGRVAKIPLFLNNLYVNLSHGSYASRYENNKDVFFYGQRGLSATKVDLSSTVSGVDYEQTPELIFLAKDSKGIDAGATKVFCMKKPMNYLGDPRNRSKTNSDGTRNGPNGQLEDEDNITTSPYETLDAMMLPIGEGGNLGGCFYIDVPHPELEHNAKFNNNKPQTSITGINLPSPYILFDLQELKRNPHTAPNGTTSASLSINDIMVDMEDTAVFPNWENNGSRITPYYIRINDTPMAYGLSRSHTACDTDDGNAEDTYPELMVAIWIYKKEGMTFSNLSDWPKNSYQRRFRYGFPDYAPLLGFFKGKRNFLGSKFPSFPNPAMTYQKTGTKTDRYNNWMTPGFIGRGSSGATNPKNAIALIPPSPDAISTNHRHEMFKLLDRFLSPSSGDVGSVAKKILKAVNGTEQWDDLSRDYKDAFNGRFFLNWLAINPRRHSANFWPVRPTNNAADGPEKQCGDFLPAARQLAPNMLLSSGEVQNDEYTSKLANLLSDKQCRYIPYGYIFGIPYADDDSDSQAGAKPIHNRRLFVNGSLLTTYYNMDYNAQAVTDRNDIRRNREWGMAIKSAIGTSIVYYNKSLDGRRAPESGLSQMGFQIPGPSNSTAYVGLTQTSGTDTNALHHILREDEVVHNIANLAAANLNFGAGKWDATSNWEGGDAPFASQKDANRPWLPSYGMFTPEQLQAGIAIGNSLCPSRVCPEFTYQVLWLDGSSTANNYANRMCKDYGRTAGTREEAEDKSVVYDLSWNLNDALWDEYFFSTLPYRQKDKGTNYSMGKGLATPANPRVQYINTDRTDTTYTLSDMAYSKDESDKQFEQNAAKLWINGPFNVNSTSVDAWKAILATYYGQEIEGYEKGTSNNTASAPFHRWQAPLRANNKVTASTGISQEEALFTGYRALSDEELEELASAIVAHVKDRGPFYSMSDFVNRLAANYSAEEKYAYRKAGEDDLLRLDSAPKQTEKIGVRDWEKYSGADGDAQRKYRVGHSQKGILQAAIDSTSINANFHKRYIIGKDVNDLNQSWQDDLAFKYFKVSKNVWENWRGAVGPIATGAPAYLMQQDILARLGSFLTVRSDTFKIRAYGEIRNPVSGVVEAKAWCEMTVQRTPEYMDNSEYGNAPEDIYGREKELGYQNNLIGYDTVMNETNGGLTKLNQQLGRRFKVVSFRWLNENEI